jgi:hypothetical protein
MSRNRQPERERIDLTDAEAELITIQAEQGKLDLSDPDIRRAVSRAARRARRTRMWGGRANRRAVRRAAMIGVGLVVLWVAGLFGPLLLGAGR